VFFLLARIFQESVNWTTLAELMIRFSDTKLMKIKLPLFLSPLNNDWYRIKLMQIELPIKLEVKQEEKKEKHGDNEQEEEKDFEGDGGEEEEENKDDERSDVEEDEAETV
jgi:hypothetical protein